MCGAVSEKVTIQIIVHQGKRMNVDVVQALNRHELMTVPSRLSTSSLSIVSSSSAAAAATVDDENKMLMPMMLIVIVMTRKI